jgi:Tol biopolymer transport system component
VDQREGTTSRVEASGPGGPSGGGVSNPAISANGRHIAFVSGTYEVFVRDRRAGITRRVSVAGDGTQANGSSYQAAVSADGRSVSFSSNASNLVANDTNDTWDVFVRTLTG